MDSFSKLLLGYEQFRENLSRKHIGHFQSLANGQSPGTLMITCSDSRIDPSLVTGAKPGELFVIRNAGNAVPCCDAHANQISDAAKTAELGTIQFAIEALQVKHIVVMGHTDCGAVRAMMNPDSVATLKHLKGWIDTAGSGAKIDPKSTLLENVKINVLNQIQRLEGLDFIQARLNNKTLRLHAWVFDIGSAAINTYNFETRSWGHLTGEESATLPTREQVEKWINPAYTNNPNTIRMNS